VPLHGLSLEAEEKKGGGGGDQSQIAAAGGEGAAPTTTASTSASRGSYLGLYTQSGRRRDGAPRAGCACCEAQPPCTLRGCRGQPSLTAQPAQLAQLAQLAPPQQREAEPARSEAAEDITDADRREWWDLVKDDKDVGTKEVAPQEDTAVVFTEATEEAAVLEAASELVIAQSAEEGPIEGPSLVTDVVVTNLSLTFELSEVLEAAVEVSRLE